MEQINFREEWELIIREFNTPKFHEYTVKKKEKWFNLQLLLTIIEGSKDREQKTALEDLYLKSKQQFFAKS